jgi:hypothetical protein
MLCDVGTRHTSSNVINISDIETIEDRRYQETTKQKECRRRALFRCFTPFVHIFFPKMSSVVSRILTRQCLRSAVTQRSFAAEASSEPLVKTALYDLHVDIGGDMVPFAGYELPVLYKGENGGVMKEHLWCREEGKASLFDVSHMGQVIAFTMGSICLLARLPSSF